VPRFRAIERQARRKLMLLDGAASLNDLHVPPGNRPEARNKPATALRVFGLANIAPSGPWASPAVPGAPWPAELSSAVV
jgi:hypothetical protein